MKYLDLTKECIKVLGVHISYKKKLKDRKYFCDMVKNIYNLIQLRRMRHLSLEGKITIFKSLALSQISNLALLNSKFLSWETKTDTENLPMRNKRAKKKHDTLLNKFTKGGLKSVDIKNKISALKCCWIQTPYNENFNRRKLIPLRYIHKAFGKNFKVHSNLHIPSDLICTFPSFYQNTIRCVKSVRIRSYSGPHFLAFRPNTERYQV